MSREETAKVPHQSNKRTLIWRGPGRKPGWQGNRFPWQESRGRASRGVWGKAPSDYLRAIKRFIPASRPSAESVYMGKSWASS